MTNLLPCGCGGKADPFILIHGGWHYIQCTACESRTRYVDSEEKARRIWNVSVGSTRVSWQPWASAPQDNTRILCRGFWNENCPVEQDRGKLTVMVGIWSSLMSDGKTGYQWFFESMFGGGPIDAVTFIEWALLPD